MATGYINVVLIIQVVYVMATGYINVVLIIQSSVSRPSRTCVVEPLFMLSVCVWVVYAVNWPVGA